MASFESGHVYVTAPGIGLYRQSHQIFPNLTEINIQSTNNTIKSVKTLTGILIESSVDTAVFVLDRPSRRSFAADGYMLIPEDISGQSYIIPSFTTGSGFPRLKIIGTQNRTVVNVTFMSNMTNRLYDASNLLTYPYHYDKNIIKAFSIDFLEVVNLHVYGDPSGTIVESSKPVAVVSEEPDAIVKPDAHNGGSYDKLATQVLPVNQWGTVYIVPPIYPLAKYLVRVFAYYNATSVFAANFSNTWNFVINRGEFKEFEIGTNPLVMNSSKPFSIIQYSFSQTYLPGSEGSMTTIPSVDHFSAGPYVIPTEHSGSSSLSFTNYMSIVIKKQFKDQIMYNGSLLRVEKEHMVPILSDYAVLTGRLNLSATVHLLSNKNPLAKFGVTVYGMSDFEQYGFLAGMDFSKKGISVLLLPLLLLPPLHCRCDHSLRQQAQYIKIKCT